MQPTYLPNGKTYSDTDQVPHGFRLFYRCRKCDGVIPSAPRRNIGCTCGMVFIDFDCHRLFVESFADLEVVRLADGRNRPQLRT
jgi:hypothetical protein